MPLDTHFAVQQLDDATHAVLAVALRAVSDRVDLVLGGVRATRRERNGHVVACFPGRLLDGGGPAQNDQVRK